MESTHAIQLGDTRAVVSEFAAALRSLSVGGTELVEPHTAFGPPPLAAGAVLVPGPTASTAAAGTTPGSSSS